jgi:acyl transferase domain-containing protein/NAD(P)-dependent dehydrogenase (short-subunit alcohol dehydrogenase family)/acyl carrier protein
MDIFKRHFAPVPLLPDASQLEGPCVLLTDSDEFARWGREVGLTVMQVQLEQLLVPHTLLAQLDASGARTLLFALGADGPAIADYPAVSLCAQACLALLKGLIGPSRTLSLVGLRRRDGLAASVLDGMALSACQETARLRYTSLEVEGSLAPALLEAIVAAVASGGLRYRFDGHGLTGEVLASLPDALPAAKLRQRGCYVVTGGGGGVGRLLCRWLAREFQANVCVIGRSPVDQQRRATLQAHGVASYVQADVADVQALEAALEHFKQRYGAIDGVFHLAGATADRLLINKTADDLQRVLLPKVAGALNIKALDSVIRPGFVCLFSSLSGLVGNVGQADYAAANAVLDELVDVAPGAVRWQSINWGLWASEGMQMASGQDALLALTDEQALEALRMLLDRALPRAVVFAGSRTVLGTLNPSPAVRSEAGPSAEPPGATHADLEDAVTHWVREVVQRFSGIANPALDDNLLEHGLDSVASINIATELARRLSTQSAVSVRKTLLFEYSSVGQIVGYLLDQHRTQVVALFNPAADTQAAAVPVAPPVVDAPMPAGPREAGEEYRPDDIAIIGVAGEFPGADTLEQLWDLLASGTEAVSVIPPQRWDWQRDYSADPRQSGSSYGRHGGFLRRAKQFDPGFFSITPVDAVGLDPQERRLLEMAYHALEDSGHFSDPDEQTGVFTAAMFGHYQNLNTDGAVTSSSFASIANRISYTFNFQGPSLCVDTMCSGSLTALHLAINSLRNGECRQALVGAVNIMPHPGKFKQLSAGRFLSPSGRCHSFGIEADGYVPGEGAIALMLKPLAEAQAGGDRIWGVIRASALNSGGRSSGFTVPSARAQEQVIRQALSKAGVDSADIDYVEAHGTGTRLGDPIEISALSAAYGKREGARRCIGSIKSNIGHLESAAGLAGLVKILLQFQHRARVPTLNCAIENPWLNLGDTDFRLPHTTEPWSSTRPLLAGLSSFGAGGANAHVIVQQYVGSPSPRKAPQGDCLLPVSARTSAALQTRISELLAWLDHHPQANLEAVAYTLGTAREHFAHRACFIGHSVEQFKQCLRAPDVDPQASPALLALRQSYLAGETLNFAALYDARQVVSLPHYPFEEHVYWNDQLVTASAAVTVPEPACDTPTAVCFQPVWEAAAAPATGVARGRGALVFCSPQHARLLLGEPGIVVVTQGDQLRLEEHAAQVRWDSIDDCRQVLERYGAPDESGPGWLINLLQGADEAMSTWQFCLAKAISASQVPYRMAFVHEHAPDAWPTPVSGALNRLFQVLHMERRGFELVCLAVAPQAFEHVPSLLVTVLEELATAAGGIVAIRRIGAERWQSCVREVPWPAANAQRFRHQGVYLITGGMGLVGQAVARHLVRQFDARVVLVGRSPESETLRQQLAQLAAATHIEYISADLSDSAAVNDLVQAILDRHGALHGVLHGAGVTRDGLLQNKSLDDFQQVTAVKIHGARHLDSATAGLPLDFFVLFSSVSGLFGNIGQGDYAVANHYLDLFAEGRQQQVARGERHGLSLSINWPLWLEPGDAREHRRALGRYLHDHYGMQPLEPGVGAQLLVGLVDGVASGTSQIAPFFGDCQKIRDSVGPDGLRSSAVAIALPEKVAGQALKPVLLDLLGALTGLRPHQIDEHCSFGDLGLNSVMLQELALDVEHAFKVPVAPNTLFTYNSVVQLLGYLQERGAFAASLTPVESTPAPVHQEPGQEDMRIAIIGMDGRLPGGEDLHGFWDGLLHNRSAIRRVERWPDKECQAGTIPGIEQFDPRFFGLSAREAMLMDPQHRLFLQACYNTLLDAGYAPSALRRVGVFAGVQFNDYQTLLQRSGQNFHPYAATGNAHAMLANRVSYLLDFEGPSQTIDTACSSALVAVNRAVMALQRGECDYALAGAVSLLIDSDMTEAAQSMGVLSPAFRCATFDSEADGYVRAEGVGSLLLKRLVDARRDGDSIHGVIEACEENHGGRANSLTAPNPNAQKRLLLAAYTPSLAARVSYIETHGTGTRLGDPVEIDALKGAWQALVPGQQNPVLLGSVKTNVGHLEPAAAVASLFKVILAFKHRVLPANLHFSTLNPYIDFQHSPFRVLERNTSWEGTDRVAGISSFGFGGTNAHVVLSEPPARVEGPTSGAAHLVVLSARSQRSLLAMQQALLRHLESATTGRAQLADIAFTLGAGREHFEYRLAWGVGTIDELMMALRTTTASDVRQVERGRTVSQTVNGAVPALREHYLQGGQVQWLALYPEGRRLHLPGYVFDTRAYWFDDESQTPADNR